ncbi:AbrB/MazE/SpoVT family DNA-binding domain-containing protein [Sporosarcina limicola]|uniref:Bifunctional DNA-binding transcriptional regulator/antitoxin component of YhaV-PrlF toxin-antitoxin module n=1 Tax=Sporosarcina limicola TaxID=34101 RepID=A0A927RB99_9BACL|nr:AbrB/MazE/SpoVT family DNA-binding domain-containing protein [Sporosarcina limicola]MBE1553170.1 bifunctional DNA-binding transcriptional regulator/antitoxin component of YhaV-PrlF toxin-antitoxin module [Sporosarcina limicola]
MPVTAVGSDKMERKIISVSKKRQITIPLKFFNELNLDSEVECFVENDVIVIRPLHRDTSEFSLEILKDLVSQGFSGDELIKHFEIYSRTIQKSIGTLLEEADQIASDEKRAASFDDVFGSENG